jgi:MFS family permease
VLPAVVLLAQNVAVLAITAFVLGIGIAPALINMFALIERIVPARSLTEGLSWIITGLNVGYGTGAAVVGGIADQHGARAAFLVVIASSLPVGLLGAVLRLQPDAVASPTHRPTPVAR